MAIYINSFDGQTQKMYDEIKGVAFAWIGQNASTGNPNPTTGLMSMYGGYLAFASRADRDQFVHDYYNNDNPSEYAVACSVNTGRKYSLGVSTAMYIENLYSAYLTSDQLSKGGR